MRAKRALVCPRMGVAVTPVDCLTCEEPCAPRNFLFSLVEVRDIVDELELGGFNIVGVSELVDCPRRAYWKRVEPLEPLSWDSLVRIMIGSASHEKAADADNAFTWNELPILLQLNNRWILIGRVDVYDPYTQTLWDIKTTSYWAFRNGKLPYEQHVWQLSLYKWLLERVSVYPKHAKLLYVFRDAKRSQEQWVTIDVTEQLKNGDVVYHAVVAFIEQLEEALEANDVSQLPFPSEDQQYKCEGCPWRDKCLPRKNGQVTLEVSADE